MLSLPPYRRRSRYFESTLLVAVWQVRSDDPNTYSSDGNPHVSIAAAAIAKIEEIRPVLLAMTESQIEADVRDASSGLRRALHLAASGRFEAFYAPLDWVNDEAKVIIVGVRRDCSRRSKRSSHFAAPLPQVSRFKKQHERRRMRHHSKAL